MKVLLASQSEIKVAAVRLSFQSVLCRRSANTKSSSSSSESDSKTVDDQVDVVGVKVASGVNEQPFGLDETSRGCANRMEAAMEQRKDDLRGFDYVVAIENGVFAVGEQYYDAACIMVRRLEDGAVEGEMSGVSQSIRIPKRVVDAVRKLGFDSGQTIGDVMAEEVQQRLEATSVSGDTVDAAAIDSKDPHKYLTSGWSERSTLLTNCVLTILGQLEYEQKHADQQKN
eukprot:TRINITY_DN66042_c12_g1_i1.p2 TRINITY_DN66042_c12_g1~~TRINITY_DN66042_c12_g1_i1.p2  ORF type:complete len:228 (-),score=115.08 TRINITY_DN66042_c12_g1_i1:181-864(-)